jgi:hypothetical protein
LNADRAPQLKASVGLLQATKGERVKNMSEFGSVEATHRLRLFFDKQAHLVEQSRSRLMPENEQVWVTIIPLLYSIKDSCDSISFLAERGKTRDCFVLARTVFETIVNVCFISAKGDEGAERAKRHAVQKSYRDLQRELNINSQKLTVAWSGQLDPAADPELQAALADFTSRKGREITSWTPESVKEQIAVIDAKYGSKVSVGLQFSLLSIFRHASEIAHGTLFGALFSLGLTSPSDRTSSAEGLQLHQRQNLSMLLMMLGLAMSSLIALLDKELSFPDLYAESEQAVAELRKEAWVNS